MEPLIDQVDKLERLFNYTSKQVGDDEAGEIINKLGIDNPHISRIRSEDNFKELIDKLIKFRKILKTMKEEK